jgi:protein O-GlcNAc transferase
LQIATAHHQAGRLLEAEVVCKKILQISPAHPDALNLMGMIAYQIGMYDVAAVFLGSVIEVAPQLADAHNNLGVVLMAQGQVAEAAASYQTAISLQPRHPNAHYNLGNALKDLGKLTEAIASYRKAVLLSPNNAELHNNLAYVLQAQGKLTEAIASYLKALKINPNLIEVHYNLADALREFGQLDEAVAFGRLALLIKPDCAESYSGLGNSLQAQGKLDEAIACYRQALSIKPDSAITYSNLLHILSLDINTDAKQLFAEHQAFAERFEAPLRAGWQAHTNSKDPDRCLQVGFVSGDFRDHPVASFLEPVLVNFAKEKSLSLHAYYTGELHDDVTQRLRGYFSRWNVVNKLDDTQLDNKIRSDHIDILFDLSAHTCNNRLLTFARKPAPIQISWMGYPGTTGLQSMDYYFTDRFLLPPGKFDEKFTEKLVHLPASAPFLPAADAPPVNTLPALDNGYVTFGSFNRLNKFNQPVIALWSQLLRALPNAQMLLGAMSENGNDEILIDWFAQEGIDRARLTFHPRSSIPTYLALHHQVDICLDTFPYAGGTTTLHALWMGVPTLTLAGTTVAGRTGACILGHVGLDAFVAQDAAAFVQQGLSLVADLKSLAHQRSELRQRFSQSAPGQPEVIAAGLASALRTMWQRWCAGLPTESFEVNHASVQNTHNAMQEAKA